MRRFILNVLVFLLFSALFSIGAIFLPPSHWDAIVVLFSVLIFLNKKPALVFSLALISGFFQAFYDLTDMRLFIFALIWNVCLSVLFIILYNAARKRFFERFFIFR